MESNKLHKDFQLNGNSFSTVKDLLFYAEKKFYEFYPFLKDWFSSSNSLPVKTSGSTGKPKPIQLKKEHMLNSALATGNYFNLKEKSKVLHCLPVNYIAGKMMLIRAITLGWHIDIVEPSSNPLKEVSKEYDFSAMVPLQLENSLQKLFLIRKIIVGGGVVSNQLQKKIQALHTKVFATYGMTETITHIAVKELNNFSLLRGETTKQFLDKNSFYKVLPNVKIYIDSRNCLVIDAPKVSKDVVFTNDVVQLVSENQFEWLGRFDNVINSGGVKLHPEIIEKKLSKIITETRFFVTGIPDEKYGEKLILVIEGNNQLFDLKSIDLPKFERPKEIYYLEKFIETETKKIQRKKTLDKII